MHTLYDSCVACPRACGTNRNSGNRGFCGESADLRVSWAGLHFGEEPPVTGAGGSGTIFITGCNLRCKFCQNFQISQNDGEARAGRAVDETEFADICLALEKAGAENINIVTGSHAIPAIAEGLTAARARGLAIPILWNSSSYETPEALALLDGLVNVWLPDLKTLNPLLSENVFRAADYPKVAKRAIRFMADRSPLAFSGSDYAGTPAKDSPATGTTTAAARTITSGVIVRHLALPGRLADTELVLRWFAEHLADKALLSLMTQYTPVQANPASSEIDAFPNRALNHGEYGRLTELLDELGLEDGFYQELVEDTEWLPDFERVQPFSSSLAKPVWHWKTGFIEYRDDE
jgi:putative pyruvate formate lyase activating enzyme